MCSSAGWFTMDTTDRLWLFLLSYILCQCKAAGVKHDNCAQDIPTAQHKVRTPHHPHETVHIVRMSQQTRVSEIRLDLQNCSNVTDVANNMKTLYVFARLTDLSDVMHLRRSYNISCFVPHGEDSYIYSCDLPRPTPTTWLRVGMSNTLKCAIIQLRGCPMSTTICSTGVCHNGGTCIGVSECVCQPGFYGRKCRSRIEHVPKFTPQLNGGNQTLDCSGPVQHVSSLPSKPWKRFFLTQQPEQQQQQQQQQQALTSPSPTTPGYLVFKSSNANCTLSVVARTAVVDGLSDFDHIFRDGLHENGFTHKCTISFGKNHQHDHVIYLYNTHQPFWDPTTRGASLTYSNGTLTFRVNDGRKAFLLQHHWNPALPDHPYVVTSSYSPVYGLSVFVNGAPMGNIATYLHHSASEKGTHLCLGSLCSDGHDTMHHRPVNQHIGVHYAISDIRAVGASVENLVVNGLAQSMGLSSFGHTVTTPTTVSTSKSTTTGKTTKVQTGAPATSKPTPTTIHTTTTQPKTTVLFTATPLHHHTSPGQCRDTGACAPLVALGYAVCADSKLAHGVCRRSCNHCGDTTGWPPV